jgi:hypothetical protein
VEVGGDPVGQRSGFSEFVERGGQDEGVVAVRGGQDPVQGMPLPWTGRDRFMASFPRSTGLRPTRRPQEQQRTGGARCAAIPVIAVNPPLAPITLSATKFIY